MNNLDHFNKIRKFNSEEWIVKFFEENKIGTDMKDLGLSPEDFTDEYRFEINEELNFSISEFEIDDDTIDYYRYESEPGHNAERPFCRTLMAQSDANLLFTFEDITRMNNAPGKANRAGGGGYSVFKYRGGDYCKHTWAKYRYNTTTKKLEKSRVQPRQVALR